VPTIDHCPGCPYREFGPAVGPRGDPASRIVLVGEAPGREEIKAGRPFVGPAGRVLSEALAEAGLTPGDLFITNAVACVPHPVHPWVTPSMRVGDDSCATSNPTLGPSSWRSV
jgi:uracil-DNA glycosylase family 4